MPGRQHVISEWLLKDFASETRAGRLIATYHKASATFGMASPRTFTAVAADHDDAIEAALARIENRAAPAIRRLVARAANLAPGLVPLTAEGYAPPIADPKTPVLQRDGMTLYGTGRTMDPPDEPDREAIANFLALMYTRCPKVTSAVDAIGRQWKAQFIGALRACGVDPPEHLGRFIDEIRARSRWRWLPELSDLGAQFTAADWWILRAPESTSFVLGDSVIAATASLGHIGRFIPVLSDSALVVTKPLAPHVALVVTRSGLLPVTGSMEDMAASVNTLIWTWADEYVVASDRRVLDQVRVQVPARYRNRSIAAGIDTRALGIVAAGEACTVAVMIGRSWRGHSLVFGSGLPPIAEEAALGAQDVRSRRPRVRDNPSVPRTTPQGRQGVTESQGLLIAEDGG